VRLNDTEIQGDGKIPTTVEHYVNLRYPGNVFTGWYEEEEDEEAVL
jgi:hypothetical protein